MSHFLNLKKRIYKIITVFKPRPDQFLKKSVGVIHVGANTGQERTLYQSYGLKVIWIEPIPEVFRQLSGNIIGFSGQKALQALITDVDNQEVIFNIASNNGASSSIYNFKEHKELWPQINFVNQIKLISKTLPTLVQEEQLDMNDYDTLIMDTQGSELLVLKGAIELIRNFKYIKLEVADFECYEGAAKLEEVQTYMNTHGFEECKRKKFKEKSGVGNCYDILYRRIEQ